MQSKMDKTRFKVDLLNYLLLLIQYICYISVYSCQT